MFHNGTNGSPATKAHLQPKSNSWMRYFCPEVRLQGLHVPELVLDSRAVSTMVWWAPGHYGSICQDRSKSTKCATHLLNIHQLILDSGAITTMIWIAPCHTFPFCKIAAKAPLVWEICWTFLSWSWTLKMSSAAKPEYVEKTHATTLPPAKIAAKAKSVPQICSTFLSWSWTLELSPPSFGLPQVTTLPSAKIAAKARSVPQMCWTFLSWCWTLELSPPQSGSPQVTTVPSAKMQQKHRLCEKSAQHFWADVRPWSCHHHGLDGPMSGQFPLPKLQQKHRMCHKSAAHSWADLGPWSCHHHFLDCPRSPRFHLPKLQQKHRLCEKSAQHFWADVGPWSCHHHGLDCPMWQFCCLHYTTKQTHLQLQLSLAAVQWQWCCLHSVGQKVEESMLDSRDVRLALQVSGNVAPMTVAQRVSNQQWCQWSTPRHRRLHTVHLAGRPRAWWNCQPPDCSQPCASWHGGVADVGSSRRMGPENAGFMGHWHHNLATYIIII